MFGLAGLFANFGAIKSILSNKLVWAGAAIIIAYFAGYNGAKTKFTNYALVAALESEKAQLATEYEVLLQASKDTAAQLAARTSLQLQQEEVISNYTETLDDTNSCQPTEDFLRTINSLTGVTPS